MQKRTLSVLAVVAFAGAALPFGLPKNVAAAPLVASYNSIFLPPQPIDQPGMLNPGSASTNTVHLCAQPLQDLKVVPVGTLVFLSIDAGLFTAPPAAGGAATAGTGNTTLTSTPVSFPTVATCSYSNPDGTNGTISDAVAITYTGPSPTVPINGRDIIAAESDASSFDLSTGQCTGPGTCNTATYVFSPVASYVFSAVPIAAPGSLLGGASVNFMVTAEDASSNPIPGAFIDLSLQSSAVGGGSAMAVNILNGHTTTKTLNSQATNASRFGATTTGPNPGSVTITYTTPATLPAGGTDTVTAQNHPSATVTANTTYTYGGTVGFSQAPFTSVPPFRLCDTRPAGGAILPNQCNAAGQGPLNQTIRPIQTTGVTGSNVPGTGVTAVILNVTAITPTRNTYITVYPAGASKPATSSLNPVAGTVVANLIEVGVNGSGQIDVFNDVGTTGLLIDVEGYVSAPSTGVYHSLATPNRICDTRPVGGGALANQCNVGGTHPINGGTSVTFNVDANGDGVPTTASAVVFNLTAISPTINTVLTAYAGGATVPNASNLNLSAHQVLPNRVVVPVGAGGVVSIRNSIGSVNVAVDIDGYFLNSGSGAQFTALPTPARVCNTIGGTPDTGGCVNGAVGAGHVLNIFVTGIDGIPALGSAHSPVALVVNVTAVNASTGTVVTVYPGPADAAIPIASDLNLQGGQTVPNLVFVGVGSDGSINLFNDLGNVNLIVDVLGYYS